MIEKRYFSLFIAFCLTINFILPCSAETPVSQETIFNDKFLLDGYTQKFSEESFETILAMIQDDAIDVMKLAAVVRVFREKYSHEVVAKRKSVIQKFLIRALSRTDSAFVEVEIMHTLCVLDRYQFFEPMVPALILKLDHYDGTVNDMAYHAIEDIVEKGNSRAREARIIFNTLRNVLFLSRRRIADVKEPDLRLTQKLKFVRWSMKVLGSQEIRRLPKEVIPLL